MLSSFPNLIAKGQARAIADMFGMPGEQSPVKNIDEALPDVNVLKQLRDKLLEGRSNRNGN